MSEVYVKLMNKGLKYDEHNAFSFSAQDGATVEDLIDNLHDEYGERFQVYLDEKKPERALRRDTIVIVNGMNMVARDGIKTKLSKGDLIVFMIAAVGG